jgi:hypothetical protein
MLITDLDKSYNYARAAVFPELDCQSPSRIWSADMLTAHSLWRFLLLPSALPPSPHRLGFLRNSDSGEQPTNSIARGGYAETAVLHPVILGTVRQYSMYKQWDSKRYIYMYIMFDANWN